MKIDCELVRDMYPLYEENELSPNVKKKIREHLNTCTECSAIYQSGSGFSDMMREQDSEDVMPPKSLDDKIALNLKIRRMKVVVICLLAIIFTSFIQDYLHKREIIANSYHDLFREMETFTSLTRTIQDVTYDDTDFYHTEFSNFIEGKSRLEENLNLFEKMRLNDSSYYFIVEQDQLIDMVNVMQFRNDNGLWDSIDSQAYRLFDRYVADYEEFLKKEYDSFHHGYSSYLELVDVNEIEQFYERINELSHFYTRYHKLPKNMKEMEKSQLTMKLQHAFGVKDAKVTYQESSPLNEPVGTLYFELTGRGIQLSGEINAYTGQITEASKISKVLLEGELKSIESVKKSAKIFLENLYGEGNEIDIEYLAENYNFSSNVDLQLYSFSFTPNVDGLSFYTPFNQRNVIHFEARSGEFYSIDTSGLGVISDEFYETDTTVKISTEEAEKHVLEWLKEKHDEQEDYIPSYADTVIIKSLPYQNFSVVHLFGNKEQGSMIYVNAKTGKRDTSYTTLP